VGDQIQTLVSNPKKLPLANLTYPFIQSLNCDTCFTRILDPAGSLYLICCHLLLKFYDFTENAELRCFESLL
jgi:hypothetical protein